MPLNNIKVWEDDEVITHDDLNSIGEAVSQTLNGGSIAPTQLAWPLVAQGDIDMNGFTIRNIDALSGIIHVNDGLTLQDAIALADTGSIIIIDPGTASPVTASDILIDGLNDVMILGYSSTNIVVGGSVTGYGLRITPSCNRIHIDGIRFSGGTTGKPAVMVDGGTEHKVTNCTFQTPIGLQIGSVSNTDNTTLVQANTFNSCTIGIRMYNARMCQFVLNKFIGCTRGIHLPGDSDGGTFQYNQFAGNIFYGVLADGAVYGLWTGTVAEIRGFNRFENNIIEYHASNPGFNVEGYFQNSYISNHVGCVSTIKGNYQEISGNTFKMALTTVGEYTRLINNTFTSSVSVSGNYTKMDGNSLHGALTCADLADVIFTNNSVYSSLGELSSDFAFTCGNAFFGTSSYGLASSWTGLTNGGWVLT